MEEKLKTKAMARTYVKLKALQEEDMSEVPTNSDGLLPKLTVTDLFEGEDFNIK